MFNIILLVLIPVLIKSDQLPFWQEHQVQKGHRSAGVLRVEIPLHAYD